MSILLFFNFTSVEFVCSSVSENFVCKRLNLKADDKLNL